MSRLTTSSVRLVAWGAASVAAFFPACTDDFEGCEAALECEGPDPGEDGQGRGPDGSTGGGGEPSSGGPGGDRAAGGGGGDGSDPCDAITCLNGGVCVADGAEVWCDCEGTGYEGASCENNIDECEYSPCQNGGVCNDTEGGYFCDCSALPDYTGGHCELLRFEALPEGFEPYDISPEGDVVVGHNGNRAAKYLDGKEVFLGTYLGDVNSIAFATSARGAIVVGASGTGYPLTDTSRAVIWKGTTIQELEMPEGYTRCEASDVSVGGNVIVGTCDYSIVRWVDGELEVLGVANGVDGCHQAVVSADGKLIGGSCILNNSMRAFVWSEETGFQIIVPLPSASGCNIRHLSNDGWAGTGYCASGGSATVALYWNEKDGPRELVGAEPASTNAGTALSGDGSFLVGYNGGTAAYWDDVEESSKPLRDLLPESNTGAAGWSFTKGINVSSDRTTIVGEGYLDGEKNAFILRID
jgi:hypothetical protein